MRLPGTSAAGRSFGARARRKDARDPAALLLGAFLVCAPQLLGGVFWWGIIAVCAGALVCLGLAIWPQGARRGDGPVGVVGVAMCVSFAFTVLQCVPLPCGLIRYATPTSVARVYEAARALGEHAHGLCTLSQDPAATREEVLKGAAIVGSFFAAWLASGRGSRKTVLWGVGLSAWLMSVVGLAHAVLGLDKVFGIYQPHDAKRLVLLAPLMNQNNLGGFLVMGVPLWIGLGRREGSPARRGFAFVAAAMLAGCVVLTLSRAAIGTLLLAGPAMGVVVVMREKSRSESHPLAWLLNARAAVVVASLAVGLAVGVVGGYGGTIGVVEEFRKGGTDKFDLIIAGMDLAQRNPWFGVGRGAFSSTFTALRGSVNRFEYPENFIVQWLSEWGFPVALFLLGSIMYALRAQTTRVASTHRVGATIALLAAGCHNLLDLALENVGITVVVSALLACAVAPSKPQEEPFQSLVPVPRVTAVALALVVITALAMVVIAPRLRNDGVAAVQAELQAAMDDDDRPRFRATLQRGLHLHPSEAMFALQAAAEALNHADPSVERYLQLARLRSPDWPEPHVIAAQWAFQNGQLERARNELHSAASLDEWTVNTLVCALMWEDPNLVYEAAPTNSQRFRYLEVASGCLPVHTSVAESFDGAVLHEFPTAKWPRLRQAQRLARAQRIDEAVAQIDAALTGDPRNLGLLLARTNILLEAGRAQEALATTVQAERAVLPEDRMSLLQLRLRVATSLRDSKLVGAAAAELRALSGFDSAKLAEAYAAEGAAREALGELGAALQAFGQAVRINPDSNYQRTIARLAERLGDRSLAAQAYAKACADNPTDLDSCAKRQALSQAH